MMKKLLSAFMVSEVVFLGLGGVVLANNHSDTNWGGSYLDFKGTYTQEPVKSKMQHLLISN